MRPTNDEIENEIAIRTKNKMTDFSALKTPAEISNIEATWNQHFRNQIHNEILTNKFNKRLRKK